MHTCTLTNINTHTPRSNTTGTDSELHNARVHAATLYLLEDLIPDFVNDFQVWKRGDDFGVTEDTKGRENSNICCTVILYYIHNINIRNKASACLNMI